MKRTLTLSAAVVICWLGLASALQAQVFVRAPFVRVAVGGGVYVRAPFVNLYVPPSYPVDYGPRIIYGPSPFAPYMPPAANSPQPPTNNGPFVPPAPQPAPNSNAPPAPVQPVQAQTIEAFAKNFQAKAGSYEVTMLNPITQQPNNVRFILPEGTPRRVVVRRDAIEFVYSLRQWVRIEFDRDGVQVTSR